MSKKKEQEQEQEFHVDTPEVEKVVEGSVEGLPNLTIEEILQQGIIKLDLGGGDHPAQGYLNVDIQYYPQVDLLADVTNLEKIFPARSVDAIMCRDTLQCFPHSHVKGILQSWYRILKPRSRFVVQCYDTKQIVETYQAEGIDFDKFKALMYGKQRNTYTSFHNCFDEESLVSLLERVGFEVQEIVHPEMRIKIVATRAK